MTGEFSPEYRFLYLNPTLRSGGIGSDARLSGFVERQKIQLRAPASHDVHNPLAELQRSGVEGIVFLMNSGLPDLDQIRLGEQTLSLRRRVWFYWPGESAVESIDRERLSSYRRHVFAANVWYTIQPAVHLAYQVVTKIRRVGRDEAHPIVQRCRTELDGILAAVGPVPLSAASVPSQNERLPGTSMYLRTDYWAPLTSGGSYGHTCYVALSLSRTVEQFVCFTPSYYQLLDDLGVEQIVLPAPGPYTEERDLLLANEHYYPLLRAAVEIAKPAFIYERLCLGNYCAAQLSQEFGIPYIVEYNGSEIEMSRSFGGHALRYEAMYLKAEEAAFRQATAISVISDPVKDDLVARGIPESRILVNPNGVDPEAYAPPSDQERKQIRDELGCSDSTRLVGFIGTFGGWHGIDVLAQAIPQICRDVPNVRFLLVGDGNYKHLVDSAVTEHGLQGRVINRGRVPQREGGRLLGACDIYVSPHSRVMSSGRFFGSPTKLFEYMAMARGIVASDLDQIGEILSPALRVRDLNGNRVSVTNERAVLCKPGDVREFVTAVEYLTRNPSTSIVLGRNARTAALSHYTWDRHIGRLWTFLYDTASRDSVRRGMLPESDGYQKELRTRLHALQSRRYTRTAPHTLDWYLEAEAERYNSAPWIKIAIPFRDYARKKVLEIEAGIGTDLCRFANFGADVTDLDSSAGNLLLAKENFRLRGLNGTFVLQETKHLPFDNNAFDLVYCDSSAFDEDPATVADEILRVLKADGRLIASFHRENSFHYWYTQFFRLGLVSGQLRQFSMSQILSRNHKERDKSDRAVVRVYSRGQLERLFSGFSEIRFSIMNRTLMVKAAKQSPARE